MINQAVNDSYAQETVPDVYEMRDDLNELQESSEAPLVVIDSNLFKGWWGIGAKPQGLIKLL